MVRPHSACAPLLRPGAAARLLEARGINVPTSSGGIGAAGESGELDTDAGAIATQPSTDEGAGSGQGTGQGAAGSGRPADDDADPALQGGPARRCAAARARATYGVYAAMATAIEGGAGREARSKAAQCAGGGEVEAWEQLRPVELVTWVVPSVAPTDMMSYATSAHSCQPMMPSGLSRRLVEAADAGVHGCTPELAATGNGVAREFCRGPLSLGRLAPCAIDAAHDSKPGADDGSADGSGGSSEGHGLGPHGTGQALGDVASRVLSRWQCSAGAERAASSRRARVMLSADGFLEGLAGTCASTLPRTLADERLRRGHRKDHSHAHRRHGPTAHSVMAAEASSWRDWLDSCQAAPVRVLGAQRID